MDKHIERAAFEAWMREECGADDVSLQICEGGHYGWGRTCDMWAAWNRRASQAPAPSPAASIGEDAEFSEVLDDVLQDTDLGYEKRERATSKIVAAADRYIAARLASQSASAKDAADAARYRWLRAADNDVCVIIPTPGDWSDADIPHTEALDAAIDAARAAMTKDGQ